MPKVLRENSHVDGSQPLAPFRRFLRLAFAMLLGWPAYLTVNAVPSLDLHGREYKEGWPNHFLPSSPIFNERERIWVRGWEQVERSVDEWGQGRCGYRSVHQETTGHGK